MKTISNIEKISLFLIFVLIISCNSTKLLKSNTIITGESVYKEYDAFGEYIWTRGKKGGININKKILKKFIHLLKKGMRNILIS